MGRNEEPFRVIEGLGDLSSTMFMGLRDKPFVMITVRYDEPFAVIVGRLQKQILNAFIVSQEVPFAEFMWR